MIQFLKNNFILLLSLMALSGFSQETKSFSHLSVSLEAGTTGGGIEISTSITSFLNIRGGVSLLPFAYNHDFHIDYDNQVMDELRRNYYSELNANNIDLSFVDKVSANLKAKTGIYNGKILADIYPSKSSSFHITAGLYFGKKD